MPHITLSYSANLAPLDDLRGLFDTLHRSLAKVTGLDLSFFKSRALQCDQFFVGDGAADQAFAHLEILIFPGRPIELRQAISEAAMATLTEHLRRPIPQELTVQFTVDLGGLDKETYQKVSRGPTR
jgi:5-carboxymethyl-2-hydroxymuconate isomerase